MHIHRFSAKMGTSQFGPFETATLLISCYIFILYLILRSYTKYTIDRNRNIDKWIYILN